MSSYIILLVAGLLVILSCLASLFWFGGCLLPLLYKGAPFVPSSKKATGQMIELAKITQGDRVADLGCGDGRMLVRAIKAGASSAEGYEIHPGLVWVSRFKAKWYGMGSQIRVHYKTFWEADLSNITVVFLYQLPEFMDRLSEKLKRELPEGARVVSHAFPFSNWEPAERVGKIYLYKL